MHWSIHLDSFDVSIHVLEIMELDGTGIHFKNSNSTKKHESTPG